MDSTFCVGTTLSSSCQGVHLRLANVSEWQNKKQMQVHWRMQHGRLLQDLAVDEEPLSEPWHQAVQLNQARLQAPDVAELPQLFGRYAGHRFSANNPNLQHLAGA